MNNVLYAKEYRKATKKIVGKDNYWRQFKKIVSEKLYKHAYTTAFDPSKSNLELKEVLEALISIAVVQLNEDIATCSAALLNEGC